MNGLHYPFTPQQQEVLTLLAQGLSMAEAARRISITDRAMHMRVKRIRAELECSSSQLVVFAVRWADVQKGKIDEHSNA